MHRIHDPGTHAVGLTVPSPSAPRMTRAGDDDRRRVMDLLQAHYVAGRLSATELEERIERALAARVLADLDALLADLPRIGTPADERSPQIGHGRRSKRARHRGGRKPFRAHAASYLMVMVFLVAIWLLTTPGGYFWPVWPMLGWGIGLASHALAASRCSSRTDAPSGRVGDAPLRYEQAPSS
jgi:DUF1707 SHOCT-like domain/2TM domain